MNWRKLLPIIGLGIFIYIILKLDLKNILNEIVNVKLNFLPILIFFMFLYLIMQTVKWLAIARVQNINVPFIKAMKINFISGFYSFITPSKIGGVIRADYLKKYTNGNLGKGVSNFVIDKTLDLCSLVFLVTLFILFFRDVFPASYFYYAAALLIFLLMFVIIIKDRNKSKKLLRIFYNKLVPEKIKEKLHNEINSFYEDMPKAKHFILFFLLNLLNWVILYTIVYFIGLSLGINVPYFYFLAINPIATLIGQLPITINGLGTREAILISLFGLLGVEATKVFSMSILGLLILELIPLTIAIFLIFKGKDNL